MTPPEPVIGIAFFADGHVTKAEDRQEETDD